MSERDVDGSRRNFLWVAGAGLALASCGGAPRTPTNPPQTSAGRADADERHGEGEEDGEEEISPVEDLMREHGVLERILLIYEECQRQAAATKSLPAAAVSQAAGIVRRFVEDYHEKLEEEHLFPRFEQAGKLVPLVTTLRAQHQAGRRVTDEIFRLVGGATPSLAVEPMKAFIRMYRPHAAREDTVLFPALRSLMSEGAYEDLGERFEAREHELFGAAGFHGIVEEVAAIEESLGIESLAQFTPRS